MTSINNFDTHTLFLFAPDNNLDGCSFYVKLTTSYRKQVLKLEGCSKVQHMPSRDVSLFETI